jgi:L-lactate dehydrogenase (cytochrome)
MKRAEAQGVKAFVWTIDAPATSTRHRAARYDTTNAYVISATCPLAS